MSLARRIIPCLDTDGQRVVKGVNFVALRDAGDPVSLAARYNAKRIDDHWEVMVRGGRDRTGREAVAWAREGVSLGAGEILLTSVDRDGTQKGFDVPLTAAISSAVSVPVIASGGAKLPEHFAEIFSDGAADAALAASIFHDSIQSIRELKTFLAASQIEVRLPC